MDCSKIPFESPRKKKIEAVQKEIDRLKNELKRTDLKPWQRYTLREELESCAKQLVSLHEDI